MPGSVVPPLLAGICELAAVAAGLPHRIEAVDVGDRLDVA
jgi:hypothetical protein